ncbi:hypothetical protein [Micromonospora sp. NPDC003776]
MHLLSGWVCLGIGVLLALRAVRLLRMERQQHQRPLRREPLSGRELLGEGLALAVLGAGNLLGGRWVLLAVPAVIVIVVLAVRLFLRLAAGWSRRPG